MRLPQGGIAFLASVFAKATPDKSQDSAKKPRPDLFESGPQGLHFSCPWMTSMISIGFDSMSVLMR